MAAITLAQRITTATFARLRLITTILEACDIADIMLELSEREIYNDIRASCDITEILTIRPDATPEFFDEYEASTGSQAIDAGETVNLTVTAVEGMSQIAWRDVEEWSVSHVGYRGLSEAACLWLNADAQWWIPAVAYGAQSICKMPSSLITPHISWEITNRGPTTATIQVTNGSSYDIRGTWKIGYLALSSENRFLKYRVTDTTSIEKYGRRVMNLKWPLGQHPNTMQQMINDYLERYAEPVPMLTVTIQGKTDRLATFVMNAKIDDLIRVEHSGLGINHDFWINQLMPIHRTDGMLECDFTLEQQRDIEALVLFEWDTSVWDGEHVWAP